MNNYCRLSHVKRRVDGLGVMADYDDLYLHGIEAESRNFDNATNRHFYTKVETVYLDGDGTRTLLLPIGMDLLSVDSLKADDTDDGTYEVTLTEDTDFRLVPLHTSPKHTIELLTRGGQLGRWPAKQTSVELTGKFGYSELTDDSGLTGTVNDSSTTLTASGNAGGIIERGDTLILGTEQMHVTAVGQTDITVERGINGTTPEDHSTATINIRRFPVEIEQAIADRVIANRWDNNTGEVLGEPGKGVRVEYAKYRSVVNRYRQVVFA